MLSPHPKRCEKCDNPSTHKFTQIVNGTAEDHHYCDEHAAESSRYIDKAGPAPHLIEQLLKGIYQNADEAAAAAGGKPIPDIQCHACGLSFKAYKRTLLLGCPDCYRAFEELLTPELRKFHGEIRHVGRRSNSTPDIERPVEEQPPSPAVPEEEEAATVPSVKELRGSLRDAVEREDFVEAARLRDTIRESEQQNTAN